MRASVTHIGGGKHIASRGSYRVEFLNQPEAGVAMAPGTIDVLLDLAEKNQCDIEVRFVIQA